MAWNNEYKSRKTKMLVDQFDFKNLKSLPDWNDDNVTASTTRNFWTETEARFSFLGFIKPQQSTNTNTKLNHCSKE